MLRPGTRASRGALLAGAAIALVLSAWLAWSGIGYLRDDCGCARPMISNWFGWLVLGLAVASFGVAGALAMRAMRCRP